MLLRNRIALILIIFSLLCLYPGLFKPIMRIEVSATLPILGKVPLHDTTQSIVKSIQTLHKNNNTLVAGLILLFSIIVPLIKALTLLVILLTKKLRHHERLYRFVDLISKWSMADVFVVGTFLAFLASRSNPNIHAEIHQGFYYFLAYCLISLMATQMIKLRPKGS
ncbi:MAG: paraquat-inducible protein A [Deltaproteobacteria bacterium]|nr:paraquat-inducible protein A [Deltaproteobacteria bacterium]